MKEKMTNKAHTRCNDRKSPQFPKDGRDYCEKKNKPVQLSPREIIHNQHPAPPCETQNNHFQGARCENIHNASGEDACANIHKIPDSPLSSPRLNKFIASTGFCSRRKADELVAQGLVKINGETVTNLATHVLPEDTVMVGERVLGRPEAPTTLLMNKPVEIVTTSHDPQKRRTVIDLLPDSFRELRLFPVGRLDYFSEGLLILTNDGGLANRLMHPRHHLPKTYEVLIRGAVPAAAIEDMRKGMSIDMAGREVNLLPVKVQERKTKNGDTLLTLVLRQGVNRQIRRMAQKWDLTILRLKRTKLGNLELGALKPGEVRMLDAEELDGLG